MGILKDVTEGIEPFPLLSYQQVLRDRMNQGGFKKGQMTLYSAGRGIGKSTLNSLYGSTGIKSLYYSNPCKEIVLPMKPAPKYKFSRAKWYEADYDWVHYDEVREWCTKQFGPHPTQHDAWSRWDHRYEGKIYFRDEKDYHWFILRWGA
jgi:hypothetical protein